MRYHRHLLISCAEALAAIFYEDRHADKCIEYYLRNNRKWGSRDRRFFAETVYDCVRWWSLDRYLLSETDQKQLTLKSLAASFWRRNLPLPDFEEFNSVSIDQLQKSYDKISEPWVKQAYPEWLYKDIAKEVGAVWDEVAGALNNPNSLVIRVNESRVNKQEVIDLLKKEDIQALPLAGAKSALIIPKRVNIFRTSIFKKGFFEVQDGSSQQVADFLDLEPGMRVIDACAGAGGKTLHIADKMANRGKIISLDIHQWKLDQLKLRARRNRFSNIEMKAIESSKVIKRLKHKADRLLLDVPCSGLGVLRRNPDTKWKMSQQKLDELRNLQADILNRYSDMLKPGGKLLYATCSLLPSENQDQVSAFLATHADYQLLKQRTLYPTRPGYDGFFMALMQKN